MYIEALKPLEDANKAPQNLTSCTEYNTTSLQLVNQKARRPAVSNSRETTDRTNRRKNKKRQNIGKIPRFLLFPTIRKQMTNVIFVLILSFLALAPNDKMLVRAGNNGCGSTYCCDQSGWYRNIVQRFYPPRSSDTYTYFIGSNEMQINMPTWYQYNYYWYRCYYKD